MCSVQTVHCSKHADWCLRVRAEPAVVTQPTVGPEPASMRCPHCVQNVTTTVTYLNGLLTWLCVIVLFLMYIRRCLQAFWTHTLTHTHTHTEILNNTQVHVARAQLLADHVRAVLLLRLSGRAAHVPELQPRHRHQQTHMIHIATTPLPPLLPTRLPLASSLPTDGQTSSASASFRFHLSGVLPLSDSIFSVPCRSISHSLLCVIFVQSTLTLL